RSRVTILPGTPTAPPAPSPAPVPEPASVLVPVPEPASVSVPEPAPASAPDPLGGPTNAGWYFGSGRSTVGAFPAIAGFVVEADPMPVEQLAGAIRECPTWADQPVVLIGEISAGELAQSLGVPVLAADGPVSLTATG